MSRPTSACEMKNTENIKAHILALPEVAAWPEIASLLERVASKPRPEWDWPVLACQSVGGDVKVATVGAAAIACMYISIILVDDLLDGDPRGEHLRRGIGPTANMALAFQAAAFRVIELAPVSEERRADVTASLGQLALATALGQNRDMQGVDSEEDYWKVVRAKSTPFYSTALHVGALLGDACSKLADGLRSLGILFGEIIQIHDDLLDAFQTPATPDWTQGRPNLLMLYARIADHPDGLRFRNLLRRIEDPQVLQKAQQILINCGAVSYCAYHLTKRHQEVKQLLDSLQLPDQTPMIDLRKQLMQPLIQLLSDELQSASSEAEMPMELMDLLK